MEGFCFTAPFIDLYLLLLDLQDDTWNRSVMGGADDYKKDSKLQKQMLVWCTELFSWNKWIF